jgi:hypothetical protein
MRIGGAKAKSLNADNGFSLIFVCFLRINPRSKKARGKFQRSLTMPTPHKAQPRKEVDDYIASFPKPVQAALAQLRQRMMENENSAAVKKRKK